MTATIVVLAVLLVVAIACGLTYLVTAERCEKRMTAALYDVGARHRADRKDWEAANKDLREALADAHEDLDQVRRGEVVATLRKRMGDR